MRRLAFVGGPEHQELMLHLGRDSHSLRVLAVLAIGRMGTDEYIYKVLEGLELPRRLMEQPIFTMLNRMDGVRFDALMKRWDRISSPQTRKILLVVAAHKAPAACVEWLPKAERDGAMEVRAGAARACGMMATEKSLVTLLRLLKDRDFEVRARAARALGRRRELTTLEPLVEATKDSAFWVRQNAAAAILEIGELGRRRLEELVQFADDPFAADAARQELERYRLQAPSREEVVA